MSRHLVSPIRTQMPLADVLDGLRQAHGFLVKAARATLPALSALAAESWGTGAKRAHVALPQANRPPLLSPKVTTHSFAEVMNQCATLERMIDALAWAQAVSELKNATVIVCNPTTSSAPRKKGQPRPVNDHDLVIVDSAGGLWRFEISDVASDNDGNKKEKKDLISLGVLLETGGSVSTWPNARSHLVVSSEFGERLRRPTRHGLRLGLFHYAEVKKDGGTRIFEVRQGRVPT